MDNMEKGIRFSALLRKEHSGNIENLDKIDKLLFTETTGDVCNNMFIGIDFINKQLFYNVNPMLMARVEPTAMLGDKDIEWIRNIVKRYEVNKWQQSYDEGEDSDIRDGYGWCLWIAGCDGVVELHRGFGTDKSRVTPDGFKEFESCLMNLASRTNINC